ncbi:MAG: hypothetical protein GWN64_06315 [Candidatus Thorarchaeota archaeon]|nr:hypothetical protein [Candidatus Thorarchaeota archaeon]
MIQDTDSNTVNETTVTPSASSYDHTFGPTSLEEGKYTLTLSFQDTAGNPNSTTMSLVVDTTPPTLSSFKIDGKNISDYSYPIYKQGPTVSVDWMFSNPYFNEYTIEIVHLTGSNDITYADICNPDSKSPSLAEGTYNIIITAWDKSGNRYELNLKEDYVNGDVLILDRTDPVIHSLYPHDEDYCNTTTVKFSWKVSDGSFERGEIYFYNKGKEAFYNEADGKPIDLAKYYSGNVFTVEFWLEAYDTAGNRESTRHREITVDTVKPTVTINTPESGSYNASEHILVDWMVIENYYKEVSITILNASNNDLLNSASFEYGYQDGQWTATVGKGEYEINMTITAWDEAGNRNTSWVTAYIDTEPPSLYGLTCNGTEKNGIWYINTSYVMLPWEGGDKYFSHWEIATWDKNTKIYNESVTSKVLRIANAEHTINVLAYDLAGNINEASIDLVVDTTPPECYFASLYAESNKDNDTYWSVPAGIVPLTFTLLDDYNYSVDYYMTVAIASNKVGAIVYESLTPLLNGSENTIRLNVTNIPQGVYDLTMRIHDAAGNIQEKTFEEKVIVDTEKPTISFITANETAYNSTNVSIAVKVEDISHFTLTQYTLYSLYGNAIFPTGFSPKNRSSGTFTLTYNISSNGTYFLPLQVVDLVGQNTTTGQLTLYVDVDPPKIEEISIHNETVYGMENMTVYVTMSDDTGLQNVFFFLDANLVERKEFESEPHKTVSVNLTGLSNGEHTLVVVVLDRVDRSSSDSVNFVVDTINPKPSILQPLNGARLNNSSVFVKYTIDEENLHEASLYLDGREYSLNKTSGKVTFTLGEGGHSLLLLATDKAGNIGKDETVFTIDTKKRVVDISYEDTFIDSSLLLNTSNAELAFNTTCAGNY